MDRFKKTVVSLALLLLFLAAVLHLVGLPLAIAGDNTLFLDLPDSTTLQDEGISQAKWVVINWNALENPQTKQIKINLFDGETITAVHERTDPSTAAGGYVWVGHVPGDPNSSVTLSVVNGVLIGSVTLEGIEQYTIRYKNHRQLLQAIDPNGPFEVEGPDMMPAPADFAQEPNTEPYCEDGSRVDLLVAYTYAARVQEGGTEAIEALLNQRVASMNKANENSGLSFTFRLVQVMETSYAETGDVRIELQRLRYYGDGYLDDVIIARDQHLADMVSLIIAQSTVNKSCGLAYSMQNLSTTGASSAFNVSALDYAGLPTCNPLTMAHEFGHNMGNYHDRANAGGSPIFPYSYGYQSPNNTFRTIMAYDCADAYCPRINHWSNPDFSYVGEPTGIDYEANPGSAADNARSMAETAYYVANFRQNCSPDPISTPTATATSSPTPTSTIPPQPAYRVVLPLILAFEG